MIGDLTHLKEYLNLFLTGILTISTVLLAIYTWLLVRETRKMRKEQIRPNISIFLKYAEVNPRIIFLVIENNGHGTAYDLKFNIEKDLNDYGAGSGKIGQIGIFKNGMKHCPAGYSNRFYLTEIINDYKGKMSEELIFKAHYNDAFNESIVEAFHICVNEISQNLRIDPDTHIGQITKSLSKISDNLEKFTPPGRINLNDF